MSLKQNKLPIVEKIYEYIDKDLVRLHMPAHKGISLVTEFDVKDFYKFDVTEVFGFDDLHQPQGIIKEAQKLLQELYKTKASFFLINGATSGIHAALFSQIKPGEKVLLPRHSHRSLFGAMILLDSSPVYLPSEISHKYGMPLGVDREHIKSNLQKYSKPKILFLQSPTYEGISEDITFFKKLFGNKKMLLVDEAHGGHFYFHPDLPPSALELGAHIVVHGAHKTVGSFTQTGFLHVNEGVDIKKIKNALSIFQSTSPSYLLLASLDAARYKMATEGRKNLDIVLKKAAKIRKEINKISGFHCFEQEETFKKIDTTKLVITSKNIDGYTLEKILREEYKIQVEMAAAKYIIAMLTIGDINLDENRVIEAFKDISVRYKDFKSTINMETSLPEIPPLKINPREAYLREKVQVNLKESRGEISGETISPYPPGVPVICAGEEITPEIIEYLLWLKKINASWQGSLDPELKTISIIK